MNYLKVYTYETIKELGYKHCGIYLIFNTETGQGYVGQAADILLRWEQHCISTKHDALHEAMRIEGLYKFNFIVLEETTSRFLDELEYGWIKELGTNIDGYNSTAGNLTKVKTLEDIVDIDTSRLNKLFITLGKYRMGADYDYIHGTDNPKEIDSLLNEIEGYLQN